jgi:hypothetical protein
MIDTTRVASQTTPTTAAITKRPGGREEEKMDRLTDQEIREYAIEAVRYMGGDDRESFRTDPEAWRDGITTNHAIAYRDGQAIYIADRDEWCAVRNAMLARILDR